MSILCGHPSQAIVDVKQWSTWFMLIGALGDNCWCASKMMKKSINELNDAV